MNNTKKIILAITILVVGALFGTVETGKKAAESSETDSSFYESAYAKATGEQKEELDKIIADESIGLPGEWRRPVLIAIGELPEDTPRLTAAQAGKLYDSKGVSDLESEFNKIAGAPDFVGGSGIERSIYFLNDDRTDAIILMLGDVFHIVYNADGTQTRLAVGGQELPEDPSPYGNRPCIDENAVPPENGV